MLIMHIPSTYTPLLTALDDLLDQAAPAAVAPNDAAQLHTALASLPLSPQQRALLAYDAQGLNRAAIAEALGVSVETIETSTGDASVPASMRRVSVPPAPSWPRQLRRSAARRKPLLSELSSLDPKFAQVVHRRVAESQSVC